METAKYPWEGSRTVQTQIRLTPAERDEIEEICRVQGGISIAEYLRRLHHKAMGRLKEGGSG